MTGLAIEKSFNEPWQARLFAMTVQLQEVGLFTWPQWSERFGAQLKKEPDYFLAWEQALEALLADLGLAQSFEIGLRAQTQACYPRVARAPLMFVALDSSQAPA